MSGLRLILAVAAAGSLRMAFGADFCVGAYGAKGDGSAKDTAAFQRALDDCARSGGGRVVVAPGTYLIGSIYLGDATELHLQEGATLLGSPDLADYNAPNAYPQNWGSTNEGWSAKHLILALERRDVSITGRGAIDGNARAFFGLRPQFTGEICWRDGAVNAKGRADEQRRPGPEVVFVECSGVSVRGVTLRNMCCWSCLFHGCDGVTVGGVTVLNDLTHLNTDGFDVDSCRNVRIGDCNIRTGDDAIAIRGAPRRLKDTSRVCENVHVSNVVCRVSADGVRVGVGDGAIDNVLVENMAILGAGRGLHVQCCYSGRASKGVDVTRVTFSNISIANAAEAILVGAISPKSRARLSGIVFRDVRAESLAPSIIAGNDEMRPDGILFERCSLRLSRPSDMPEDAEAGTCSRNGALRLENVGAVTFVDCTF